MAQTADPAPVNPPVAPATPCEQMQAEVRKYTDWDTDKMVAIAKAESNCDVNARGDGSLTYINNGRTYGYSVSVFQVRILEGREYCDTYDLAINVKCAHEIYKSQGLHAWSVYNTGKYLEYLD